MLSEETGGAVASPDIQVLAGSKKFTSDFYKVVSGTKPDEDLFFSPLGIHAVLSMLYLGAAKDTKDVLAKTLHVPEPIQTAEGYDKIIKELNSIDNVILHFANKVYLKDQYKFQKEYGSIIETKFHAEVNDTLKFGSESESAAKAVNFWVNTKTNGKIPTLFDPDDFDEDTRLVLVNAIYFKGNWANQFEKEDTRTEPFYVNGEDDKIDVQMMHKRGKYKYKVDKELEAQVVELPFKGDEVTMIIVLPSDINGITSLEKKIEEQGIDRVFSDLTIRSVKMSLPKFKMATKINLKDSLMKMGFDILFDKQMCNLQGMIDANEQFYVSKAIQKALMEINEEGAEAAAVTEATVSDFRSLSVIRYQIFYADHPFLVILRKGDTILFYGKIMKPVSGDDERAPRSEPNRAERPTEQRMTA